MQTVRSIRRMQKLARALAAEGKTIGLVPTMGYLHEGHLSLIRRAKKHADIVIVSIFVNPTQFGPREDLKRYPRDEKGDLKKIKQTGGDIAFIPTAAQMYPDGFSTWVEVKGLTDTLEGASRPGHFRGVTTVVAKLFNICRPDVVVFGLKDYQQAIVLRQMTRDLNYPVKYLIAPTVREPDGLAMSSRNAYFSPSERREAVCLYYALRTAKAMVRAGVTQAARIEREMRAVIRATCPTAEIDYIAFTDYDNLKPVRRITKGIICSLAVRVHGIRLIDNMKLS
ncbi:MAG: pantoate--beta-alanine ligase [Candidatus Zixiibacteriota bacterium]|nr:MAG: pantoate--beta-alanine ligase [candidate division Zixibacteria bacterium]